MLITRFFSACVFIAVIGVTAWGARAQQSEMLTVPIAVLSSDGKPLDNLRPSNIRIRGLDAQTKSLNLDTGPRKIVLLFDVSGSMGLSNGIVTLWDAVIHTAKLFLSVVPQADLVSVHVFAEKDSEVVPFTHDFGKIRSVLDGLPIPGSGPAKNQFGATTNFRAGLNSVLATLPDPDFGDAVLIFSDGEFPRSNQGDYLNFFDEPDYLEALTPKFDAQGIRAFFSLAGDVWGTPPLRGVEAFMQATGGESFELAHSGSDWVSPLPMPAYAEPQPPIYCSNSLPERAVAICNAIQNTYRLQLQLAQPLNRSKRLHVSVVDNRGKTIHEAVVLYPSFVYPESGAQH